MTSRRVRSSFRPVLDTLPGRIAPTIFAPPPPLVFEVELPTMDVLPVCVSSVPNDPADMMLPPEA